MSKSKMSHPNFQTSKSTRRCGRICTIGSISSAQSRSSYPEQSITYYQVVKYLITGMPRLGKPLHESFLSNLDGEMFYLDSAIRSTYKLNPAPERKALPSRHELAALSVPKEIKCTSKKDFQCREDSNRNFKSVELMCGCLGGVFGRSP